MYPTESLHYRPIALTAQLKVFERLVLNYTKQLLCAAEDKLEFAYKTGVGVDDAIYKSLRNLEISGNTESHFVTFLVHSTLSSLQYSRISKNTGLHQSMVSYFMDYLSDRAQYVRMHNCVSQVVTCSTGVPQGMVLAPFLYIRFSVQLQKR